MIRQLKIKDYQMVLSKLYTRAITRGILDDLAFLKLEKAFLNQVSTSRISGKYKCCDWFIITALVDKTVLQLTCKYDFQYNHIEVVLRRWIDPVEDLFIGNTPMDSVVQHIMCKLPDRVVPVPLFACKGGSVIVKAEYKTLKQIDSES